MADKEPQGDTEFTAEKMAEIRKLISQTRAGDREAQRKLRRTLRTKLNFFISRFGDYQPKGFTLDDLDQLIADKKVTITDAK